MVAAACTLFGRHGYANVSVDDVVAAAGVTKGAAYHHFRDKRDLLRAAIDDIEGRLAAEIRALAGDLEDPAAQLVAGSEAFLERCLDKAARQIVLLDGPAVLGWRTLREIDTRHGLGIMIEILERGMARGRLRRQPARPLAHLVLGAAIEAGMLIAHARDPDAERARVAAPLVAWLRSLQAAPRRRAVGRKSRTRRRATVQTSRRRRRPSPRAVRR